MKKNSASLAICAGNSSVPLSKQSWGWWFEKLSRPLWRHRNATNHYLSQCWLRPLSPYGVTRLHWIKPPMTLFITSSTRVVPVCIPEQELVINITARHHGDVTIGAIASQITSLASVYSAVKLGADQRKHQSSASLAFVRGIHRRPVNSPHKGPETRKMFPFDDVIMVVAAIAPFLQFKTAVRLRNISLVILKDVIWSTDMTQYHRKPANP